MYPDHNINQQEMFDNLGTNVQPITDQEVNDIFADDSAKDKTKVDKTKDKTKDKDQDDTKGKTKVVDKTKSQKKATSDTVNTDLEKRNTLSDLTEDDEDDVFAGTGDEDDEDDDTDDKGKTKKKVVKKDEDTDADDDDTDDTDDTDADDTDTDDTDDDGEPADEEEQIKDFLKQRAELLIKKGAWADYEGREDEDWTEERFEEVELDQRNYQKQQMTDEILDSFGPIGKEIATFTANGGNPDDLLDIFKEQQRVESFSVESEESQKAIVLKYETEFLGKKPERVKKYIDTLIADKELQTYAVEAKEAMELSLAQSAEDLQNEQKQFIKAQEQKQKSVIANFSANVTKLVNADDSIPVAEKQQLIKVLTRYDKRLPNGTPVNEFYQKFAEFKKDMPNYLKLVRFVLNPEKFEKEIKNKATAVATEKAFKLARSSSKARKVKGTDITPNGGSSKPGTKFRLI